MELDEEYPKTCRRRTGRLSALLQSDSELTPEEREEIAASMNQMADKARDLDDIVDRLLNETHTPGEVGELLIAFELTTESLRGHSDTIDGKLYEIADRLKGVAPSSQAE
jgi:hypothetical protein